jgi:hypothetical protein
MNNRLVSTGTKTVCAALFVSAFCSMAHADNEDVIALCARVAGVGDRILCLENALRRSSQEVAAPPPAPQVLPPPEKVAAAVADVEDDIVSPIPEADSEVSDIVPQVDENFGLKETRPVGEAMTIRVTVTSVRKSLRNMLIFETENGQVWQQTDQRIVRYEDAPFVAEIRSASMGSFFLKPESSSMSVRVRRNK